MPSRFDLLGMVARVQQAFASFFGSSSFTVSAWPIGGFCLTLPRALASSSRERRSMTVRDTSLMFGVALAGAHKTTLSAPSCSRRGLARKRGRKALPQHIARSSVSCRMQCTDSTDTAETTRHTFTSTTTAANVLSSSSSLRIFRKRHPRIHSTARP